MANEHHRIIHTEGDFFQCQNYVLQLLAEGKISQPAFILYCFYKSTAGYPQINYSYEYIRKNSSISKGSITKGLKQLEDVGLVEVVRHGPNKTFDIHIVPGTNIPRRSLKSLSHSKEIDSPDTENNFIAQNHKQGPKVKNFDPSSLSKEAIEFWEYFVETWKKKSSSKYYPKNDMYQIMKIEDFEEAKRMVPVMWALDDVDKWTKKSDHTLSVFVHLLSIGKLQAFYPKTSFYYKDTQ